MARAALVGTLALLSAATTSLSQPNCALDLDGESNYVMVPNHDVLNPQPSDAFTVECWFRTAESTPGGPPHARSIIEKWDCATMRYPFVIRINVDPDHGEYGQVEFALYIGGGRGWSATSVRSQERTMNDGEWHHVAAVRNGTQYMRLYIDAELSAERTEDIPDAPTTNLSPLFIGHNGGSPWVIGPADLRGSIDEVRIWSIARSAEDVAATLRTRLTGREAGLVGYWSFDEGEGLLAHDLSPTQLHGLVVGEPMWVEFEVGGWR